MLESSNNKLHLSILEDLYITKFKPEICKKKQFYTPILLLQFPWGKGNQFHPCQLSFLLYIQDNEKYLKAMKSKICFNEKLFSHIKNTVYISRGWINFIFSASKLTE